jgi:lysosomal Pro-X carboxypeptidase
VHEDIGDSLIAIKMENGAHHVDLRPADPDDTEDVIAARKRENEILTGWLVDATAERQALKL